MYKQVAKHVRICEVCQRVKPAANLDAPLQSLPIPNDCWNNISMDFMFGLPPDSRQRTGILVFIDMLSKMVHLVPVRVQVASKVVARIFYDVIFRHHGLPEAIISDRDPRFTASFWRELFSLLGTRLVMSTADHPQTDGQTERVNRVLGDILRSYCVKNDKDWSSFLPSVEFAINSSVHVSTGYTPFYLNSFRNPKTPLMTTDISSLSRGGNRNAFDSSHHDMGVEKVSTIVKQFIDRRISIISSVRDKLAEVKDYQKEQADKKGRKNFISFNVNDLVLLSTKSLPKNSISNIGSNKLLPRYIGPFKVLKKINNTAYKLDIPSRMKNSPIILRWAIKRIQSR